MKYKDYFTKPMILMLISVGILMAIILVYKIVGNLVLKKYMAANQSPIITVSTAKAAYQDWQPQIKASGSFTAVQGVNVTTEVNGLVKTIYFKHGDYLKQGDILLELNHEAELANLASLEAQAALARITYDRDKAQLDVQAVSKETVDMAFADLKSKNAQVLEQAANIDKKIIRAPFEGQAGISSIRLGQYLNPGDVIVPLQSLNPIYFNFYIPQQELIRLEKGQALSITTDSFPDLIFNGKITTINPIINSDSRNVQVETLIENPDHRLLPGMFGFVTVYAGKSQSLLTVPQSAISHNAYGDMVYIVTDSKKTKKGKPILKVAQTFVELGEIRGNQIAIVKGVKAGDEVVTAGQLKLKNNSLVEINNSVVPNDDANVEPKNEQ